MINLKGWGRAIEGIPRYWKRSRDWQYVRLAMMREVMDRFVPGRHDFPFGRIDYADIASLEAQYFAIFVSREYGFSPSTATPVILDCGGNIGLSTLWFKMEYPGADVTVFEPGPDLYPLLTRNLERFGFTDVKTEQVAVWHEETSLNLSNDRADGGFVSATSRQTAREVPAIRLADRINGPVDLLKIDIEGAEFEVFDDLATSGKLEHIDRITGELHAAPGDIGRVSALFNSLHKAGFKVTISYARPAPALFCRSEATPFPPLCDGKYIALFYAWRDDT